MPLLLVWLLCFPFSGSFCLVVVRCMGRVEGVGVLVFLFNFWLLWLMCFLFSGSSCLVVVRYMGRVEGAGVLVFLFTF